LRKMAQQVPTVLQEALVLPERMAPTAVPATVRVVAHRTLPPQQCEPAVTEATASSACSSSSSVHRHYRVTPEATVASMTLVLDPADLVEQIATVVLVVLLLVPLHPQPPLAQPEWQLPVIPLVLALAAMVALR
jgi:hypothetical protein